MFLGSALGNSFFYWQNLIKSAAVRWSWSWLWCGTNKQTKNKFRMAWHNSSQLIATSQKRIYFRIWRVFVVIVPVLVFTFVCVQWQERLPLLSWPGLGSQLADPAGAQAGAPEPSTAVHPAAAERPSSPATGEWEQAYNICNIKRATSVSSTSSVSPLSALV